jgi:protease II
MKKTILFAIDLKTEEVIVSESEKGSTKINAIERIERSKNELLFDAVATLTKIVSSPNFDTAIFKAMDKVCQMIYSKHIENR